MIEINQNMSWDEVVKQYPDKWVIMSNCNEEEGVIVSADILAVCTDEERDKVILEYRHRGLEVYWERTTQMGVWYMWG